MAFATTSLQGRSDEQRSWDLQLALSAPAMSGGQSLNLAVTGAAQKCDAD